MEPKDDRGIAFLKIEHKNRDDEMRMWLPAFKKLDGFPQRRKVTLSWDQTSASKIYLIDS